MNILDLFCGAGGFSSGFAKKATSHLGVDYDPHAIATYRENQPHADTWLTDINRMHSIEVEDRMNGVPDVILASPPCEEFSRANPESRRPATDRIYGEGSARLLLDAIRIIGDLSPKVFIIENVAAILQAGGRRIILRELARVGFRDVWFNLIRAHQHGNPSKRLRVFISNIRLQPRHQKAPSVIETIGDLPRLCTAAILDPEKSVPNHDLIPLTREREKAVRKTSFGRGARHFRTSGRRSRANWVRLRPNSLATSVIGLSRYIHPYEDRLLTVREHARLMSYPDSFVFLGPTDSQFNQVGESVPPVVSHLLRQEVESRIA
jgi:DNA (cytosine-5)-methyltransferase 1